MSNKKLPGFYYTYKTGNDKQGININRPKMQRRNIKVLLSLHNLEEADKNCLVSLCAAKKLTQKQNSLLLALCHKYEIIPDIDSDKKSSVSISKQKEIAEQKMWPEWLKKI